METISCKNRAQPGRHCLAHTKERIKRICEKIRRNPQRSANKIAAEENVNRRTLQVILNDYLGFLLYREKKVQCLT